MDFIKYALDNPWQTLLAIGAVVSIFIGYVAGYIQEKKQTDFQNITLQNQQTTIDELKRALVEQRNLILGGESYLYLRPSRSGSTNKYVLSFQFVGQHPLYELKLKIEESDITTTANGMSFGPSLNTNHDLQTVHPTIGLKYLKEFSVTRSPNIIGKRFLVNGTARNGIIEQEILIYSDKLGNMLEANKVITVAPNYENDGYNLPITGSRRRVKKLSSNFDESLLTNNTAGDHGWKRDDFERTE